MVPPLPALTPPKKAPNPQTRRSPKRLKLIHSSISSSHPPCLRTRQRRCLMRTGPPWPLILTWGFAIKEKIVPRAVLYFTGEILEEDGEFEDVDSDETEEEDCSQSCTLLHWRDSRRRWRV